MDRHVFFLDGPIGAGKSSLGQAMARRIGAGFVEGDEHSNPDKRWYACILTTCRSIMAECAHLLEDHRVVVVAYPLTCSTWIFFKRHAEALGAIPHFIGLSASFEQITDRGRDRRFSLPEKARIIDMIGQGYGRRQFEVVHLDTGAQSFASTLDLLAVQACRLIADGSGS